MDKYSLDSVWNNGAIDTTSAALLSPVTGVNHMAWHGHSQPAKKALLLEQSKRQGSYNKSVLLQNELSNRLSNKALRPRNDPPDHT
jgi:hypothetical protein